MVPFMPEERYDRWAGETQLFHVVPLLLDDLLRRLCRRFADAGDAQRQKMRATGPDICTLVTFAGRCAVFALRERSEAWLVDGLRAIAMIDPRGEDPRDMPPRPLGLLNYVAAAIGRDGDVLLHEAASLSMLEMAELIEQYSARSRRDLAASLYMLTETPNGAGFVDTSVEPYSPSRPLDRIAVAIGALVATDSYGAVEVSVCEDLPRVWLEGVDDASLSRAMRTVRGGAIVRATMKPPAEAPPTPPMFYEARTLMIFLIELGDAAAAEALFQIARAKRERWEEVALHGVHDDRVFCLLVARSYVVGVPPVETWRSLQRFEERVTAILRRYPNG